MGICQWSGTGRNLFASFLVIVSIIGLALAQPQAARADSIYYEYTGTLVFQPGPPPEDVDILGLDGASFLWTGTFDADQTPVFTNGVNLDRFAGDIELTLSGSAGQDGTYTPNFNTIGELGNSDQFQFSNSADFSIDGFDLSVGTLVVPLGFTGAVSPTNTPSPFLPTDVLLYAAWNAFMFDPKGGGVFLGYGVAGGVASGTFVPEVDIALSSTESVDPVIAGSGAGNLVHTITAINNEETDASGVAVSVFYTFPAGVNPDSVVASGTGSWGGGNPGTWTIGNLAGGASETLTLTFTVAASAQPAIDAIDTSANVSAVDQVDINPDNDTTLVETSIGREIDITVTKIDTPDPVIAGLEENGLTYTVTATNNGPSDGDAVVINDTQAGFPAGVTLESSNASAGTYDGTDWVVDLPVGATETLELVVTVGPETEPGDDVISNTAAVTGSGGGEVIINTGDDTATETTSVTQVSATWIVNKDFVDDNTASVTMSLSCSSGTVSAPVQVSEGNPGELSVEGFLQGAFGSTTCTVTESDLPEDYYQVSSTADCTIEGVTHDAEYTGCEFVNAPRLGRFAVTKDFSDDNPGEVEVTISCNTGLPLEQTTQIAEDDGVTFVVTDFEPGEMDCEVFESVPEGYQASYTAGGDSDFASDELACYFTAVEGGDNNSCSIFNELLPVDVIVHKEWIDENPEFNLPEFVEIELSCSGLGFVGAQYIAPGSPGTFSVLPHYDGTLCKVKEEQQVGVLTDIDDCKGESLLVLPGQGAECTIVNTRLYAGIPTLSEYGLALLALLMLAMGIVAYRRIA